MDAKHICGTSVSIILPARNEQKHIAQCIDSILAQEYDAFFELIVVNDHSTDNTQAICESYGNRITLINLATDGVQTAYKKQAITQAINIAKGQVIITTDADTTRGILWLQSMVQYFEQQKCQMIAGPVNYDTHNTWLSKFQTIDFLCMQGITAASLHYHFNSTCNGANLLYTKKAFQAVNGFEGIDQIASGDDMLLLHKIERKYPKSVRYLKNKQAIVSTQPMPTVAQFLTQRIRWASKAKYYTDKRVSAVLAVVYLFNLLLAVLLVLMYQNKFSMLAGVAFIGVKIVVEQALLSPVMQFFGHQFNWRIWHILLQPVHIVYIIISGFLGLLGKYQWKGRVVQ